MESRWKDAARAFRPKIQWLDGGKALAFPQLGSDGSTQYVRVAWDGSSRRVTDTVEIEALTAPSPLTPSRNAKQRSRSGGEATRLVIRNRLPEKLKLLWVDTEGARRGYGDIEPGAERSQGTFEGHVWLLEGPAQEIVGVFIAGSRPGLAIVDAHSKEKAVEPAPRETPSPVFVRDHVIWGRGQDGMEFQLSTGGTAQDPYELPTHFSPQRDKVLGFQVEQAQEHPVHFVESRPKSQLQPKLHTQDYLKPGDRIQRPRPRLFDLGARRLIPVAEEPFADAWSIENVHWAEDGSEVFCLHNQRGHQVLKILGIRSDTGAVRTVLEERSRTFVDYSQKTYLHWIAKKPAFLWASERDGWNHLYWVDATDGAMRQITKGAWLVRKVDHIDEDKQEIWFTAYGIHAGQDPYHSHLARIRFDGTGLVVLTQGDGDHDWSFSPDRSLFVDRWSRVDQPWVTELRRSSDGSLLAEMGRDDVSRLREEGFNPPKRFVAKGRDGRTDIHGILIFPSNFDPSKRYPVVEDIYAGPHDHFVPKRWGLGLRQRMIAELGFIVVQIDGMGTNWRERAFHDICWRNLKDSGFPDRIAWIKAAALAHPAMDLTRVGIFGGSAGGQSALAALLHQGEFYHAAVADCGCHDNRMDKIWWNEAWMGYPVGAWYTENSNVTHAKRLNGKLLLTVGELDRNVDPASTLQVAGALIAADKDFDLVVVPGGGHGIGESPYLVRRRMDFFVRNLLGVEPRSP